MLKIIMVLNASSCLAFGGLFAIYSAETATFLGTPPAWLVLALGVGLILNGLNILWVARKSSPGRLEVLQFSIGDATWVVATAGLLVSGLWITTPEGIFWAVAVAVWVGACGLGQYIWAPQRLAEAPTTP